MIMARTVQKQPAMNTRTIAPVVGSNSLNLMLARLYPGEYVLPVLVEIPAPPSTKRPRGVSGRVRPPSRRMIRIEAELSVERIIDGTEGLRAEEIAAMTGLDETLVYQALTRCAKIGYCDLGDRGWFRAERVAA